MFGFCLEFSGTCEEIVFAFPKFMESGTLTFDVSILLKSFLLTPGMPVATLRLDETIMKVHLCGV